MSISDMTRNTAGEENVGQVAEAQCRFKVVRTNAGWLVVDVELNGQTVQLGLTIDAWERLRKASQGG